MPKKSYFYLLVLPQECEGEESRVLVEELCKAGRATASHLIEEAYKVPRINILLTRAGEYIWVGENWIYLPKYLPLNMGCIKSFFLSPPLRSFLKAFRK